MLHTFVGEDEDAVRETVREPMKRYLGSAMDLVRQAAWTFPTFVQRAASDGRTPAEILDAEDLSPADRDALLDHAFERYHSTGGLFGTPESCLGMVEAVRRIGTDEIACLVDFGVPTDLALDHLEHLKRLMVLAGTLTATVPASVPEEIVRHRVTHFQCTPSMARMLVADAAGRRALSQLDTMMVGGEALSADLAGRLRDLLPGKFLGMYGPTETTIWSAVVEIDGVERGVTLGEPIANTVLHVLDAHRRPCPAHVAGELHIGGEGLARGYLGREDLTAERFVPNPFGPGRLYRTGDLVRRDASGGLVFLSGGSITRSRSGGTGSSSARSRPHWRASPASPPPSWWRARIATATSAWWATSPPGTARPCGPRPCARQSPRRCQPSWSRP